MVKKLLAVKGPDAFTIHKVSRPESGRSEAVEGGLWKW